VRQLVRQGRTEASGRAHNSILEGDLVGLLNGGAVRHGCQKNKATRVRMRKSTLVKAIHIPTALPTAVDSGHQESLLEKGC
jgi:hypothetical protein